MNRNLVISTNKKKEDSNNKTQVSILGASGIGKVHARSFQKMGSEVCSILSSSESSGKDTAKELKDLFNINAKSFIDLKSLLSKSEPDAISICTPMDMHFDHILQCLDANIPVFCEKPLFWNKGLTRDEFKEKIKIISDHPNRQLFMNNSSAFYIEFISEYLENLSEINKFSFQFHTNGFLRNRDIAIDLLPHGLSMILKLLGENQTKNFNYNESANSYSCNFNYGKTYVEFDFRESDEIKKKFLFSINDKHFLRIQEGNINNYKVYLKNLDSEEIFEIPDPFELSISRFIEFCNKPINNRIDNFNKDALVMELLGDLLLQE